MEWISKKEFYRIPQDYRGTFEDYQGKAPEFLGRRTAMLHGSVSEMEGVHFMVRNDYEHLPELTAKNAMAGCYYKGLKGHYLKVIKRYRITDEYASEHQLHFLDRVKTNYGDFALVDGAINTKPWKEA